MKVYLVYESDAFKNHGIDTVIRIFKHKEDAEDYVKHRSFLHFKEWEVIE